jgi:capsular exopolysaccharide synthesis family protein
MQEADARVISEAEVPMGASFPKKNLMLVLIAMLAAFISTTAIFVLEMLNPGLRSPEEVEQFLGLPAIGLIPLSGKGLEPIQYIVDKPHSSMGEALSSLRVSLLLSDPDKQVKTIMVTSSTPSEGKSTLALCLGRSAALAGQRVVVIDADLRRPTIEKKLGLSTRSKGLTDLIMAKNEKFSDCIFKDTKTELYIMPKGEADYVNPVGVFTSQRMDVLLSAMKERFDLIIFDTPPVMAVTDARLLASHVDKTIFVVNWDSTPKKVVRAALHQLQLADASIAGIVLQQVNLKRYGSYGYGDSGYYYHYSKYGQYYKN